MSQLYKVSFVVPVSGEALARNYDVPGKPVIIMADDYDINSYSSAFDFIKDDKVVASFPANTVLSIVDKAVLADG